MNFRTASCFWRFLPVCHDPGLSPWQAPKVTKNLLRFAKLVYQSDNDSLCVSTSEKIGALERPVLELNTQLMVSPVNASRLPSRAAAHHSGPERPTRSYSAVGFHLLSFASLSWRSRLLATSGHSERCARESALPPKPDIAGKKLHRSLKADIGCLVWMAPALQGMI